MLLLGSVGNSMFWNLVIPCLRPNLVESWKRAEQLFLKCRGFSNGLQTQANCKTPNLVTWFPNSQN